MKDIFKIAKEVKKEMLVVESLKLINEEYKKQENKFVDDYNSISNHACVKAHQEKINKDFLAWQVKWKPYKDLIIEK